MRIRIEHGHLYDPFFVRSPRLYELATAAAGPLLHIYPDIYRVWAWYQGFKERARKRLKPNAPGHGSTFYQAAEMLLARGFDAVIFGHTHKAEVAVMDGGTYVNSGNWMRKSTFVEIVEGRISLQQWENGRAVPIRDATPLLAVEAR